MPDYVTQIFANRFAMAREAKGFTQQELSEKLGVDVRMIRMYESASSFPRSTVLEKLSSVSDKPIAWFFEEKEKEPRPVTPAEALSVLESFLNEAAETDRLTSELAAAHERIAELEAKLGQTPEPLTEPGKPSRIVRHDSSLIGSRRPKREKNERRQKS